MSFYSDASLVLIPSGYKDQKVYSAVPTDGSGDLVFSRASSATRVASNGLIEKVRSNRFTYSQALANAAWLTTTDGGTITKTANAGTAPDGTNTATRIQIGGGGTYSLVYQNGVNPLGLVVISGYFKRYGSTNQTFRLFGDNGSALSATLTATDTWQRFSYVMTASSTGADGIAADASNNAYDILVWGMQIESGDVATDYIATTTAAVSVGPVSGLPRLDYLNSTCPRLLLEPQRTNVAQYSEQFNNAWWAASNSTISANAVVSPDGYTNADNIVENTANATHGVGNVSGLTLTAAAYTFSVFVKKQTRNFFAISTYDGSSTLEGYFNINTGAVATMPAGLTGSIVSYGNGWYRCSVTRTMGANANNYFAFNAAPTDGGSTYTGTSAIACSLYGATIELGAYATSYIPTLGTSVTRVADAASKTGISSLIGQTEGTIFWELDIKIASATGLEAIVNIDNGSFGNTLYIYQTAGIFAAEVYASGTGQAYFTKGSITAGVYKCALAYANNNTAFFINGVQVGGTDTSCSVPATSRIQMGQTAISSDTSWTKQLLLFKTRLTNESLAELTSL